MKLVRQRQVSDLLYMGCKKKKKVIYETEVESQIEKTAIWLPEGKDGEG